MVTSKEEPQSLGENEGIVFGSFVINVEKGEVNESGWAFLKGRKAGNFEYGVSITEVSSLTAELVNALVPFKTNYGFTVKPEDDAFSSYDNRPIKSVKKKKSTHLMPWEPP